MIRFTRSKLRSTLAMALGLVLTGAPAFAQGVNPQVAGVAERETARRQEITNRASENLTKGDQLMAEEDYEGAMAAYKAAYDWLPDSVATDTLREQALGKYSKAAVELAKQRIAEGRFADARTLCEMVLTEGYNPGYRPAVTLLARIEDPEYYNQTMGPKFIGNVEEVKKFLREAEDFYESGRYNLALKRTDQVLNIDPYNVAARRLQKDVNAKRQEYADEAYDERRGRAIWEVTQKWESPVRQYGLERVAGPAPIQLDAAGTAYINKKLSTILIPQLVFRDATVREAIDFLKQRSRELDTVESDPSRKGVNIVLKLGSSSSGLSTGIPGVDGTVADPVAPIESEGKITISLSNIPLGEALKYIASLANLKVKVEPYAVSIVPLSEPTDILVTKEYRVPPTFLTSAPSPAGGDAGGGGGFGGGGFGGGDGGASGSTRGGGGGAGMGGAIFNNGGTLAIVNSTFTTNVARGGSSGGGEGAVDGAGLGGAIFSRNGTMTLTNVTISGNTAVSGGNTAAPGGRGVYIVGQDATVTAVLINTILGQADNSVSDFDSEGINDGSVSTAGSTNNLVRNNGDGLDASAIVSSADPRLAAPAHNGGPTRTMALLPGSPARKAGSVTAVIGLVNDQRGPGFSRIVDGAVDLGAFEAQSGAPLVSGFGRGRDAFVATLYRDNLGRDPGLDSLRSLTRRLAAGDHPRHVARSIWGGAEHRRLVNEGLVAPLTFRQAYVHALRAGRQAARLRRPPSAR